MYGYYLLFILKILIVSCLWVNVYDRHKISHLICLGNVKSPKWGDRLPVR